MGRSREYACGSKLLSDRKRARFWRGDGYYDQLLGLAEEFPTKFPPEEAQAADDSQLVKLTAALRAANIEDNDVPLFTRVQQGSDVLAYFPDRSTEPLISVVFTSMKG